MKIDKVPQINSAGQSKELWFRLDLVQTARSQVTKRSSFIFKCFKVIVLAITIDKRDVLVDDDAVLPLRRPSLRHLLRPSKLRRRSRWSTRQRSAGSGPSPSRLSAPSQPSSPTYRRRQHNRKRLAMPTRLEADNSCTELIWVKFEVWCVQE